MEMFRYAVENSKNPLCYNGNLRTLSEVRGFEAEFPQVEAVMIGRGLIGDPAMLTPGSADAAVLEQYHNALLEEYLTAFGGGRNAMFRMKEHWHHLRFRFDGSEKLWKRLRKTTDLQEFRSVTAEIFQTLPLLPKLQPDW